MRCNPSLGPESISGFGFRGSAGRRQRIPAPSKRGKRGKQARGFGMVGLPTQQGLGLCRGRSCAASWSCTSNHFDSHRWGRGGEAPSSIKCPDKPLTIKASLQRAEIVGQGWAWMRYESFCLLLRE